MRRNRPLSGGVDDGLVRSMVSRLATPTRETSETVIDQIRSHPKRAQLLYQIGSAATTERTALPVLSRLAAAGIDLTKVPVDEAAYRRARIDSLIPGLISSDGANLMACLEALNRHQQMLRDVANEIGDLRPFASLIAYGLAIDLVYPGEVHRQSSDVDVFVRTLGEADGLAKLLVRESGFVLQVVAGPKAADDLGVWKLSSRRNGHELYVDLFGAGRPSVGHSWVPPFRSPNLFERSRRLESEPKVLVAGSEDMLVMLAEKVLRKGEFTDRRLQDCRTILGNSPELDWSVVVEQAHRHHVEPSLLWLLAHSAEPGTVVSQDVLGTSLAVAQWERRLLAIMTGASPRTRQRSRAVHRWVWTTRHVRDEPLRLKAAREVLYGRYSRQTLRRRQGLSN